MFRDIKFSPVLLFAIICTFTAVVFGQQPLPKRTYKHDGNIEVKYDASKNQTFVSLDTMNVYENDSESLSMSVTGSYEGKIAPASPSEILFVLHASSKQRRYQTEPQLVVVADGEVVRTRQMKNYGARADGNRVIEPLLTMMPYDILVKMANAKKLTLKIGSREYQMTANNLEALRDFVSRMIP
jgi:hypothetical protein